MPARRPPLNRHFRSILADFQDFTGELNPSVQFRRLGAIQTKSHFPHLRLLRRAGYAGESDDMYVREPRLASYGPQYRGSIMLG